MPYFVQIATAIVTALISYIAKHSDEYVEIIFSKLGGIISTRIGEGSAAIIINTVPYAEVEFDAGKEEIVKKIADERGYTEFKRDLKKGDTVNIKASADGYCSDTASITIDNEDVTYCVGLKLNCIDSAEKEG